MRTLVAFCGLLLTLLLPSLSKAQPQYAFRIWFADKQGAPSLSNPLDILSQRSLDRRSKQGISLNATDQPISPVYHNDVLSLTDGKAHTTSRWLNNCVVLLHDSTKILQLQGKAYINNIQFIAYFPTGLHLRAAAPNAKLDKEIVMPATSVLKGTATTKTTGTQAYYGSAYAQIKLVNGDYLHDHGYKGEGKLIAVMDAGFAQVNVSAAFDSMNMKGRVMDTHNFVLNNNDVFGGSTHGTGAISTMAAYEPGNYVGTAPNAMYAIYVTEAPDEQEIEMDNLLAACERADSIGADIITVSLGYNTFDGMPGIDLTYAQLDGKTTIAAQAANIATTKGILFAASAGNEGSNGTGWKFILTPGDADSAITVGNVTADGVISGTSGYGPNAAGRVKPDVCMVGQPAYVLGLGNSPYAASGTSFALPQLAGLAACLWQTVPDAKPYQIKRAIIESAHMYTAPDNRYGYGIPNFQQAIKLLGVKDTPTIPTKANWLLVAPNPFNGDLSFSAYVPANGEISIVLTDISGKVLYAQTLQMLTGVQYLSIPTATLPNGVYFLKAMTTENALTQKVIKE